MLQYKKGKFQKGYASLMSFSNEYRRFKNKREPNSKTIFQFGYSVDMFLKNLQVQDI